MKIVRGFALGLVALAMTALIMTPSGAFANVGDGAATVGDFLASYAKALKLELPNDVGSDAIVSALRASGVKLDANIDASKALTQADVVRIGKANGLRLTTRNPQAAFKASEIDQFFTTYGVSLAPGSSFHSDDRTAAVTPNAGTGKGNGKQKGHVSPTEPQ